MISLSVDRANRVLLVAFGGPVTVASLTNLDDELFRFIDRNGTMSTVIDFTVATTIEVQPSTLVHRGKNRSLMSGRPRVFVADNPLMFGLLRMYSTYQDDLGEMAPTIVWSLAQAFETLGLASPKFEPVTTMGPASSSGEQGPV
jgi:hypothetical protein